MRKIILLLMLLVLCAGHSMAVTKNISSLPFSISSSNAAANDTFVVVSNLTTEGSAITVSANNVVLDLNNHTITFGTGASNNVTGILVSGDNVSVENGTLIHGVDYSTTLAHIRGIDMNSCQYSVIRNMTVIVGGYIPSSVSDGVNGIFNIFVDGNSTFKNKIVNCTLTNEVVGYYYRQYWVAAAVRLDKGYNDSYITDLDTDYHLWVCSTQVTKTPHSGFFFYGNEGGNSGAFWASDNHITVDARNDGPYTGYRYGEAYGIASRGSEHLRIWNNRIDYGTNYFGGMGIFLERTVPVDLGGFSLIHNNTIISSIGPLDATGTGNAGHSTGIRIRIWTANFKIYENDITVYSDRNPSTLYRCGLANGIFMGYDNGDIPTDSIYVYNNRITTIGADGAGADCISVMSNRVGNPADFSNNVLSSNGHMFHFGTDGGGAYGITSQADTMVQIDNLSSFSTFYLGVNGVPWSSGNNKICDGIYLSGADDTDINMSNSGNQDITIQKTLDIKVIGTNSQAVTGATVTVVNGYGQTVVSGVTNSSGRLAKPVSYWFASRTATDSTAYNNFTLRVEKGADTYLSDLVVSKDLTLPTVVLNNTVGEVDSIAPNPIIDLGCTPGSGDGNINLNWTSTGDDGASGTALIYEVKYATSPINASNFDGISSNVTNEPTPQIAGSAQSMTLSGLTPATNYYIAMKIYDDGGNPSSISNVVSCEASVDITSGGSDSIPPDPIVDLACATGTDNGRINISWRATGDDGSSGNALAYDVKYSTSTINASNFNSATTASNPPFPQSSGTVQLMTIANLTPQTDYYIAMKVRDESGNSSLISNVVNCESSYDVSTGGGGGGANEFVANLINPQSGATVYSVQPNLYAQNITSIGTKDYYFEVASDSLFSFMETVSPAISESFSGITQWQVDTQLDDDETYYWRVRVNNNPYSDVSNFAIASASLTASTQIIAFPNPVSFANDQYVTFTSPADSTVELTIQTISGETVLHKVGDLNGWQWFGHNHAGYKVAIGTYLWYLRLNGTTYSGKIVNK